MLLVGAQMNNNNNDNSLRQSHSSNVIMDKEGRRCDSVPSKRSSRLGAITTITILALLSCWTAYLVVNNYTCYLNFRLEPASSEPRSDLHATVVLDETQTSGHSNARTGQNHLQPPTSMVQNNGWLLFALGPPGREAPPVIIDRRQDQKEGEDENNSEDSEHLWRLAGLGEIDSSEEDTGRDDGGAQVASNRNQENFTFDILHEISNDNSTAKQQQHLSSSELGVTAKRLLGPDDNNSTATRESSSSARRAMSALVKQAQGAPPVEQVTVKHHLNNTSSSSSSSGTIRAKDASSNGVAASNLSTTTTIMTTTIALTKSREAESKVKQQEGNLCATRGEPDWWQASVLDGEPPIQIKWFKDNTDLSAMLLQDKQQRSEFNSAGTPPGAGQSSNFNSPPSPLEQLEMMSNDELGSSLLFRKVKQQHGGNYTCLASNHYGTSSYSSFMTVKDLYALQLRSSGAGDPPASSPTTTPPISGLQLQQHSLAGQSAATGPLQQLQHAANFKLINSNHHVQTLENGSLTIRQVGAEHEGLYLCEADNGVEPSLVKQIMLVVRRQAHFLDDIQVVVQQQQQSQQSPIDHLPGGGGLGSLLSTAAAIQQQPLATQMGPAPPGSTPASGSPIKSIKLAQNSSLVRLICTPYGDAPLQLDWLKDGRLIHTHSSNGPQAAGLQQQQQNQDGDIIDHKSPSLASSSSSSSSASYSDQVQQQHHHSSQTIGHYHVNTRWLSSPSSSLLNQNSHQQQQRFSMSSSAQASSQYHLTGGGSGGGINGLESELLLTNLARHDAGLYTCAARNAYGQSDRKLRLIVQEQPEPPTIIDVGHISSRFISLRWLAPFDGNSPILKYVVEYKKQQATTTGGAHAEHHQTAMLDNGDNFMSSSGAFVGRSEKLMPLQAGAISPATSSSLKLQQQQQQQSQSSQIGGFEQVGGANSLMQQQQHAIQLTSGGVGGLQVQHTVHDLEPMTRYSMRVIAINALGASRPSVALSLRTEEEVPATVPTLVEASVLSSKSIKLRWTISYSLEHELIDGFFIGYRSFDSLPSSSSSSPSSSSSSSLGSSSLDQSNELAKLVSGGGTDQAKMSAERPTFTYKTIRLTNQQQQQAYESRGDESGQVDGSQHHHQTTPMLAPISTITKTVPADALLGNSGGGGGGTLSKPNSKGPQQQDVAFVISNFEYVISGLERNTEYTILIQCFNKKGAGPASDPVVTKTLMSDPPEKLLLIAEDLSETSLRLSWHFMGEQPAINQQAVLVEQPPSIVQSSSSGSSTTSSDPVDGFVLTFAKVMPRQKASTPANGRNNQKSLPYVVSRQQQELQPNSAARISQQNQTTTTILAATAGHGHDHNQFNPPIEPSQLLDHQWRAVQLAPQQRQHVLKGLECGTWYAMKIWAFNKVGKGEPSELVTANTKGKAPVAPDRRSFMAINSTQVRLHLTAWYDGGCEIDKFSVQYRVRNQQQSQQQQLNWILVSNNIMREQQSVVIRDLAPATAYELLVGAKNNVGQTEAKYRFTTLDSDGKPVSAGHSFLGSNLPSIDDEDNFLIDYATTDDSSSSGMSRELFNLRGGDGSAAQLYQSTGTRWLLLIRQILNSPLTLLLAFCLFLVLLVLLVFHRFNSSADAAGHSPRLDRFNCNTNGSSSAAANKMMQNCGGGGGGGGTIGRHCSVDATTTIMGASVGGLEPPPSMSVTTNGSSSLNDSPGGRVNLATGSGRSQLSASTYAPLDCYGGGVGGGLYCGVGQQEAANSNHPLGAHYQTGPGNSGCGANNGADNYAVTQQQQHHHQIDYYSPGGAYAGVHRSATMEPSANPMDLQQQQQKQSSGQQDARHQYLMHMLMMSPPHHLQQQQHNIGTGPGDSATMARTNMSHHNEHNADGASYSMTAAALTTLARQKVATGNGAGCNGGGGILKLGGNYSDSVQQQQHQAFQGASDQHEHHQPFLRANKLINNTNELYQVSSFINARPVVVQAAPPAADGSRMAATQQQQQEAVEEENVINYYYKDAAASSESTNSGTTSGCATMATSTTSGFNGRASGSCLTDIREQCSQSPLDMEMDMLGAEGKVCNSNTNNNHSHSSGDACNEQVEDSGISLELDNFQDRNCDRLLETAATIMTKNSQYDVPFKFKPTIG